VQRLVAEGRVSAGHAKALLGTPDRAFQESLAHRVATDGLSVRETEEAVRQRNGLAGSPGGSPSSSGTRSKLRAPGLLELEELLAEQLDTRVSINVGPKRGRVVIEFADLEDLERIYRVMAGPH
jgi:ParB family chromosome partitioning protein